MLAKTFPSFTVSRGNKVKVEMRSSCVRTHGMGFCPIATNQIIATPQTSNTHSHERIIFATSFARGQSLIHFKFDGHF